MYTNAIASSSQTHNAVDAKCMGNDNLAFLEANVIISVSQVTTKRKMGINNMTLAQDGLFS